MASAAVLAALAMPGASVAATCSANAPAGCVPRGAPSAGWGTQISDVLAALNLLRRAVPLPGNGADGSTAVLARLVHWSRNREASVPPSLFANLVRPGMLPQHTGAGAGRNDTPPAAKPVLFAGLQKHGLSGRGAGLPFHRSRTSGQSAPFTAMPLSGGEGGGTPGAHRVTPDIAVSPVPLPASLMLLATGLGGLILVPRRKALA